MLLLIATSYQLLYTLRVKQKLREAPNKASTTAWPTFFYPKGEYDPEDITKGLLRNELLVYVRAPPPEILPNH